MLDHNRLLTELRAFGDPRFAGFAGSPTTRDQARRAWAHALFTYVDRIEEALVRAPIPPYHPSLDLTSVEATFYGRLGLVESVSAAQAAADFAGAWRAAMEAIIPVPTGVMDATSALHIFAAFSNLPALQATLDATLSALFSLPAVATVPRLGETAQAFHTAMSGLVASATRAGNLSTLTFR